MIDKNIDFEAGEKRLDEIVSKITSGELSLEESLALYEEGKEIIKVLQARLQEAEEKVEKIIEVK